MADDVVERAMPKCASETQVMRDYFRRLAFVLIAGFILAAPAMPQVFGIYSVFFRPWTMFSGVGVGLLKGAFVEIGPDGEMARHEPAGVLGQKQYSRAMTSPHSYLVLSDAHLPRAAAPFCETLPDGWRLAFDGYRQTRDGWHHLTSDNVCGGR